jgi:sodium/proline symporter
MTSHQTMLLAIGGCTAVVLLAGLWGARRSATVEEFHLAGRELGAVRAGLSQAACAYGLWVVLGVSGAAYTLGLAAAWIAVGILLGAALSWFYVGPAIHRQARARGALTSFELLATDRPGAPRSVAQSAAGIAAVAVFFGVCAQFSIAGGAVARGLGLAHGLGVTIVAGLTMLGVLLGGLRALSLIAVPAALVLAAIALFLPTPALFFVGGLEGMYSSLAVTGETAVDPFGGNVGIQAFIFLLGAFGIGLGLCGQPQVLEQYIATRSESQVRWAGVVAIAWFALLLAGLLLIGWEARVLYESIERADTVIFELVQRVLPPNLAALPVLAVSVAVIVGVGAQLLAVADALVLLPGRPDAESASVGRLRTIIFLTALAAGAIAAFVSLGSARVTLLCWLATAAVLGPLFLVRAAGVHTRPGFAAAAMRVGIVLTLLFFLLRRERADWMAAFVPFAVALLVAILGRERGQPTTL